jgi:NAD(P)H-hydrate epimerase
MHVVTNEQMRLLDEETIKRFVPGLTLMERAGQGITDAILELADGAEDLHVCIFLGRGNNAGDGLVVARLLTDEGVNCTIFYVHEPKDFSPDAFKNFSKLAKYRKAGSIKEVNLYLEGWEDKALTGIGECDLIVDALLGTGINSPVRDNYAAVIGLINHSGLPVMSIDIPSGVNGTTGEVMGTAVMADITVTMALPKTGALFYPGKEFTGSLEVVDIGIPDEVIDAAGLDTWVLDDMAALADMPHHSPDAHKFARGALLVVAGSRRYAGAASLAAVSALRTGCGIVYLAGPESIRTVVQTAFPEIIFISLPETESGSIAGIALEVVLGAVKFDAAAIGPGMTTDPETIKFVRDFVARCDKPVMIDADGLNAFEGLYGELRMLSKDRSIILSPHSGELKRLTGVETPTVPDERADTLRKLVVDSDITIVHKGAPTVVASPGGRIDVNAHGHPGLATAGSGDVLTGAISGMLAQGCAPGEAARVGVYIHSRAAEIAAEITGERGMIAGDCSDSLPMALRELEGLIR